MADMMFGPYRLERLVSRSGIGEVWQATDIVQGRLVALKLLPPGLASDPEFRARFRHESALAAQIDEPHIIPIHAFGEIDGRLYVDMRLIRGTDLARLIAEHGALTPARAVHITTQIAAALDAVHATGLVHGEIRPGNLLITRNNDADAAGTPDNEYVYVPDSIVGRSLNGSGTPLNTNQAVADSLEYMAPEQLLYGHGDHRVDIYALGCVLYEAITAQKPFPGRGQAAMIHAHLNAAPPRASQFRPDIPRPWTRLLPLRWPRIPITATAAAGPLPPPPAAPSAQPS